MDALTTMRTWKPKARVFSAITTILEKRQEELLDSMAFESSKIPPWAFKPRRQRWQRALRHSLQREWRLRFAAVRFILKEVCDYMAKLQTDALLYGTDSYQVSWDTGEDVTNHGESTRPAPEGG